MADIQELQKDIRKFCDDRNWSQFHNLKDSIISLNLESSEALELVQWKNDNEIEELTKDNKSLAEELSDVLYWTLLIADKAGVDLSAVFTDKMKSNIEKYPIAKARGSHKKYTPFNDA